MHAPPNYVFTICSFVAFFFCLLKFPLQFNTWNVGTHLFLAWVGPECLVLGINSIIWNHNTVDWAPVWCDITIRLNAGVDIAVPAAILCINRRLYMLASPISIIPSKADKNRELIIDLVIGVGLPIIVMALSCLLQDSRYYIVEDIGCTLPVVFSWVALVILGIPQILLTLIAGVYGCLSIRAFYNRTKQNNIHNNLNSSRYLRLICFSTCDILSGLPVSLFYLYVAIKSSAPFPGLTQVHYEFSQIYQMPAVVWRDSGLNESSFELNRWIMVYVAFVFFAIFGFTEESRNNYRAMLQFVVQIFVKITGIKNRPSTGSRADAEGITFYNSQAAGESRV